MQASLSCNKTQNIPGLFQILQRYAFDELELKLRSSSISETQRKGLEEELQNIGIVMNITSDSVP